MGDSLTFRASAPVRLDFAGGWTDVAPFATERRGVVVNAAIELRAHAAVSPGGDGYVLRSDDLNRTVRVRSPAEFEPTGELDLLKAAIRLSGIGPCRLSTRSDAPPGSGLGSSGAIDVALVAALDVASEPGRAARPAPIRLAERAWELEAVEAGLPGGKQDQYAAALGGFHRFGFSAAGVAVTPLDLDPAFREALARQIVVCYTGQSRVSSHAIARVMAAFARGESRVTTALHGLVDVAERMADALLAGDLAKVGELLTRNWSLQQDLDPGMRTDVMARLEQRMRDRGALGGKAAGAGAGGSMFFLFPGDPTDAASAARASGATVLPCRWATQGVLTC
jgi:D-glycero-alpha-D-manno-heptose-7-phosphate kinase